ncbi:hypothetical protein AAC387_Pa10g1110 [Persea americana]
MPISQFEACSNSPPSLAELVGIALALSTVPNLQRNRSLHIHLDILLLEYICIFVRLNQRLQIAALADAEIGFTFRKKEGYIFITEN